MRFTAPLFLTIAAVCCAQAETEAPPKDPIRMLADTAMAAPPELAADLLIRIAESPKVVDKAFKIELLERAFALAPSAKFKLRLSGTFGRGMSTDSDAGVISAALRDGLDTVSLQSRVVRDLLPLDRAKAMALFSAVPPLAIPKLTCKDAMTYSADEYYRMIQAVFQHGFTAKEQKDGKDVDLVRSTLARMSSPSELDMASFLILMPALAPHFEVLLATGTGALQQMQADDRTFSVEARGAFIQRFEALRRAAAERHIPAYSLAEALRAYLVRHLGAARCADSIDPQGLGAVTARVVQYFNGELVPGAAASGAQLRPITPEEVTPSRVEGRAEVFVYWETPRTKKLLMDLKQLRFGSEEQQAENNKKARRSDGLSHFLTTEQRSERAWETSVREYLKDVQRWNSDHEESEANYFHMTSIIYHGLLELIPARDLKTDVLRSYLSFLAGSPLRRESPPEWYLQLRRILNDMTDQTPEDRAWIRDEIRASGEVVMSVLIDMETLAPPK